MRYLYLIIFIFGCGSLCFAAKTPILVVHKVKAHKKATLVSDSSAVNIRNFDKSALRSYRKQQEFNYSDIEQGPSLWTRFWRWFWHLFDFLKIKATPSGGFLDFVLFILKYLFIIGGLGAIIVIIFRLAGMDLLNILRKKSRSTDLDYSESAENIHEIDFDAEIEKAAAVHNYRLAVRLLYLRCLKQLNDASLITWLPEKTNSAYINELSNAEQQFSFKVLTRQFEYVWYGDFAVDGNVFLNIHQSFQKFKKDVA